MNYNKYFYRDGTNFYKTEDFDFIFYFTNFKNVSLKKVVQECLEHKYSRLQTTVPTRDFNGRT